MLINTDKAPVARYIMLHQTHKYIHVTGSRKSLERITLTKKLKTRSDFTTNGSQASFGLRHGFSWSMDGIQHLCFFVCFCFWIQFLYFGWLLCGCDSTLSWKHLKCWHGAYIPNWTKWDKMGALKRLETDNCCIRKDLAYCSERTKLAAVWEFSEEYFSRTIQRRIEILRHSLYIY